MTVNLNQIYSVEVNTSVNIKKDISYEAKRENVNSLKN